MISTHYYLDIRQVKSGSPAPLKLGIGKRQRTAYIMTGIVLLPSEWDGKLQQVINHPRKRILNSDLARLKAQVEDYLRPMLYNGELADLSAVQIKDLVCGYLYGQISTVKLWAVYQPVMRSKRAGTADVFHSSWVRFARWKPNAENFPLRGLTRSAIREFHGWLTEHYKQNTIASTLHCFAGVWNEAVRQGKCSGNPFEGLDMRVVPTRGRDLSLEQIRKLWRIAPRDEREALALDFFKLSFLLRAINPIDLAKVRTADISNGRLYYNRTKTGKAISVKIEPEAWEIISRRGDGEHLFSVGVSYKSYRAICNRSLTRMAEREDLPPVTMYYARHTLASLLFEQGGTMDIVSAILSHSLGGARVTSTYVAVREARLDEAMRSVIDAVVK